MFEREIKLYNNIKRILYLPCDTPPSLWVEAGLPAVIKAIYSIASPDIKEAFHKVVGKSMVCSLKQEINVARQADSAIPEAVKRAVFKVAEWADMLVWYGFLASVALDGMLDWTSQILKFSACNGLKAGHIIQGWVDAPISTTDWGETDVVLSTGDGGTIVKPTGVMLKFGETGAVAVHAGCYGESGERLPMQTRVVFIPNDRSYAQIVLDIDNAEQYRDASGELKWKKAVTFAKHTCHYADGGLLAWIAICQNETWPFEGFASDIGGYVGYAAVDIGV